MKRLFPILLAMAGIFALASTASATSLIMHAADNSFNLTASLTHPSGSTFVIGSGTIDTLVFDQFAVYGKSSNLPNGATFGSSIAAASSFNVVATGATLPGSTGAGWMRTDVAGYNNTVYKNGFGPFHMPFDGHGVLLRFTSGVDSGDYLWLYAAGNEIAAELFAGSNMSQTLTGKNGHNVTVTVLAGQEIAYGSHVVSKFAITPEPSSLMLMAIGLLLLAWMMFWGKRRKETRTREVPARLAA